MTGGYPSLPSLSRRFRETPRSHALRCGDLAAYRAWREETRTLLRRLTGIDRLESCPPEPQLLETQELEGLPYRRHRMTIRTERDVVMPLYLLEPKSPSRSLRPAVIAAHGHHTGGKLATRGRTDIPAAAEIIARQNYTYGTEMASRGFLVFCPDARGFGERREEGGPDDPMKGSCRNLAHMALGLGFTVTGLWVWDLLRLVDYIEGRPDCDPDRIACVGLSGGGMQALWAAALDDRIAATAVSGYFYGCHDALLVMSQNCDCNYVPGLWNAVDMGDLGALIAPRPLVIESGSDDHLNGRRGLDNVREQVEVTRMAYQLHGREEHLLHAVFQGPHRWDGTEAIPFLMSHLGVEPSPIHP